MATVLTVANLDELASLVGREIGVTDWMTITQERIRQFAEATEDRQWIHLDSERARRESPYGSTIAHGFLTLSLVSHFSKQALTINSGVGMAVNYGLNRVRFPAPVRTGTRIRARFVLASYREPSDSVECVFNVTIESDGSEKPCCVAEWIVRYYR